MTASQRPMAKYQGRGAAGAYRRKYRRSPLRRLSDWCEKRLVRKMLKRLGTVDTILDCPCGTGRLLPVIAPFASGTWAVDRSAAMASAAAREAPSPISSFKN